MKPRPDLLPADALLAVASVMAHGAGKHGARGWEAGRARSADYAALLRHLWLWWRGAPPDAESGQSHLAHAVARGLIHLGDGDSEPFLTAMALERAAARQHRPGRTIRTAMAPPGEDFNTVWRRAAASEGQGVAA